jgi:hypothetical protein
VFAVCKGLVGIQMEPEPGRTNPTWAWLDLNQPDAETPLTGTEIATGLALHRNGLQRFPIAVGPDQRLWFVQHTRSENNPVRPDQPIRAGKTAICRAHAGQVRSLSPTRQTDLDPSIWPVGPDTAIVVTRCSSRHIKKPVLFFDRGQTTSHTHLEQLLKTHHQRLAAVMADGAAFRTGKHYEPMWLVRLGDGFYFRERRYKKDVSSRVDAAGIMQDGKFVRKHQTAMHPQHPPAAIVNRIVDLDVKTGRLLGFTDGWRALTWIPIASTAADLQIVDRRDDAWAWRWTDRTHAPRFTGAWCLTRAAVEHIKKIKPARIAEAEARGSDSPEHDMRYRSADFKAMRRWTADGWRVLNQSMYGGAIWHDGAGGLWHMRVREAGVTFADGRRQVVGLGAGYISRYRLAIESPAAVWVAGRSHLERFELAKAHDAAEAHEAAEAHDAHDADNAHEAAEAVEARPTWRRTHRFRLPRIGADFAGPCITGGYIYWQSDTKLHAAPLAALLNP